MEEKVSREIRFEVVLNARGYTKDDFEELFEEPFATLYETRVGFQWFPSALSSTHIEIAVRFGTFIAATVLCGFMEEFGKNLYRWAKKRLASLLKRKPDIGESYIYITFLDLSATVYVGSSEEMISALSDIVSIIKHIKNMKESSGVTHVDVIYSQFARTNDKQNNT